MGLESQLGSRVGSQKQALARISKVGSQVKSRVVFASYQLLLTSHFHLYPQFIYELFHILYIVSLLSRENGNLQLTLLPMCGFIAQLVEHRTGNAEVTGSNPVEA